MVFKAMPGLSNPHQVDRFGQSQPFDQVLAAVAVVLPLNDDDGPFDVFEVAEPVPVAALLLKWVARTTQPAATVLSRALVAMAPPSDLPTRIKGLSLVRHKRWQ